MGRILGFCKRALQRVNARIAILAVALAAGGVAIWLGWKYTKPQGPAGPTHQISTGGSTETSLDPAVQPASATVSDSQFGTGNGREYQLVSQSNHSYLPSNDDPAGGTSSTYSYGQASRPATSPPADPSVGPTEVPSNPIRNASDGAAGYGAQSDAGYGANASDAQATDEQPRGIQSNPPADPVEAYANRYGGGSSGYGTDTELPTTVDSATSNAQTSNPSASAGGLERLPTSAPADLVSAPRSIAPRSAAVGSAATADASLASATPGERQLEGTQQPAIAIEKFSPAEIQVGKAATFEMLVRNTGAVPAHNVVVSDQVPAGTQLLDARPQPQQTSDGSLVWNLGTLQPGDEVAIALQVMPQTEGEIGSTAHVTFAAAATSRSICTRPQLAIEHTAPPKVLIGESITVGITVSNPGTGPATGVIIEEDVPEGLSHVAGAQLEYEVGTLRPGESKRLELSLKAEKPGLLQNTIHVHGEGGLANQHTVQVEVIAPQLQIGVEGPKRRFLERQATYTVSVGNPGTAPARDVELVAFLPRGMKFVETDSQGQYDPSQHAVFWSLEELPPAKAGAVKLTTLPVEPGEQRLRIESRAGLGLAAEGEQIVQVEQSAELVHSVNDLEEVIEVGSETMYEIRVTNTGTKAATNVRVAALLPAEMQALGGEGPTRAAGDAQKVIFEPLARLNPQEEVIFKVQVQGLKPGDHLVRVQLASDEWPTPVTREESTRVYEDR
jgi:uncharacterized repeat protein (TIGR01451 family)